MAEPVIELLAQEWTAIDELCTDLTEQQWKTPTALPGWTVQDNVSHMLGTERALLGDPPPVVEVSHLDHVSNPFGEMLEVWVEARRHLQGGAVLGEYREVIPRRLEQLRAMSEEDFDRVGWSPIGDVPYREFMTVRVFDCWMHEQDIRRALDRPGHLSGPVVENALVRFEAALGYVVGKKAGAPDGSSVVFEIDGVPHRTYAVIVDGRAAVVDEVPPDPTARVKLPLESFVALGGGRWSRVEAERAGDMALEGDTGLAERVVDSLAFTP